MLEMNKEKQKEIKGFPGWLESYLETKVGDLKLKTKLQSHYKHDYESFRTILERSKERIRIMLGRPTPAL
jgi:hypothetical protein